METKINREIAKSKAQSRYCHCVKGKDRDNNYDSVIDEVFDLHEKEVKNLTIPAVSKSIIAFLKWRNGMQLTADNVLEIETFADEYISGLHLQGVSFTKRKICRCYEVPPKKNYEKCDTCGRAYQ